MTSEIKTAELLLEGISKNQAALENLKSEMDALIKPVIDRYGKGIEALAARIAADETALEKFVIKHQAAIMAGGDRVDLATGSLLLKSESRVKHIRGMLEKLKEYGFVDAIKTVESVDWDIIEKWDSGKLGLVGTGKKDKLIFGYEIRDQ
jgi:phage host-nuclease inhibitor protein Gam